jgi:voltage-gated potassium channel Kch
MGAHHPMRVMSPHPAAGEGAPDARMSGPRPRVRTWYLRLTVGRAITTIIGVAMVIVSIAAVLERIVEPEVFDNIGISYWWAVTTVTTVGYGDVVPMTTGGRIVGVTLMLTGLALIPTTTSVVITLLVHKFSVAAEEEDRREREQQNARLDKIEATLARMQDGPR